MDLGPTFPRRAIIMRHPHSATKPPAWPFACLFLAPAVVAILLSAAPTAVTGSLLRLTHGMTPENAATSAAKPLHRFGSLTVEETIRRFFDARLDPTERRVFSYRMAYTGIAGYPHG
ncbi:MAG: hypothetical protein ACJ8M1_03805 [Chthoniobacterales bacterium]